MGNVRRPRKKVTTKKESNSRGASQSGSGVVVKETESVFCVCQRPYADGDLMVCCDACSEWFHPQCVSVSPEEAQSLPIFVCPGCLEEAEAATASEANRSLAKRFRSEHQRFLQKERQRRHEQRLAAEPATIQSRPIASDENKSTVGEGSPLRESLLGEEHGQRAGAPLEQTSLAAPKKRRRAAERKTVSEQKKDGVAVHPPPVSPREPTRSSDTARTEMVRSKARDMLYDALQSKAAEEIESALFELMGRQVHDDYRARLRNLVANLRDPRNGELREAVLSGTLPANALCQMSSEELACKELRMKRQEQLLRAEKLRVIEHAEEVGLIFKEVAPASAHEAELSRSDATLKTDADPTNELAAPSDTMPTTENEQQIKTFLVNASDHPPSPPSQGLPVFSARDIHVCHDQGPAAKSEDMDHARSHQSPTISPKNDTNSLPRRSGDSASVRCFQENAFTALEAETVAYEDAAFRSPQLETGAPVSVNEQPLPEREENVPQIAPSATEFFAWNGSIITSAAPAFKPVLRLSRTHATSSAELFRLVELLGGQDAWMSETARIRQEDAWSFIRDVRERSSTRKLILFHLEKTCMDLESVARCQRATEELRKRERASLLIRDETLEVYFLPVTSETETCVGEHCAPDSAVLVCVVRRDALAGPTHPSANPEGNPVTVDASTPGFDVGLALQILSRQLH